MRGAGKWVVYIPPGSLGGIVEEAHADDAVYAHRRFSPHDTLGCKEGKGLKNYRTPFICSMPIMMSLQAFVVGE